MLPYERVGIKHRKHKKETAMHQLIKPGEKDGRAFHIVQMNSAKGKNK